ncbi:galactokinase [Austwickia chelonae]|uniref:Galactokinase n=1 Tax=Austwickia chelonae NBRC 105200 TaxID=1184607 RepID=K6VII7_9MICO|nr:galactokinase [Austwickia chelonae]GAB76524.1 galactokinase [Austwickia chelonae NBRC 105200]SEW26171.1 galactokinase [Austwickia chelonae]
MNGEGNAWEAAVGCSRARQLFRGHFDSEPAGTWAAPGRVNLIGEHTDYNGGLCLPIALPHRTYVALRPRTDDVIRMVTDLPGTRIWTGTTDLVRPGAITGWPAYCSGPVWALNQDGTDIGGFDVAAVSCVPVGAGLSSSAAIACSMVLALAETAGRSADSDEERAALATLCVQAENEIAGAPTGGMDQAASLQARAGHALLLDCRSGETRHIPFDLAGAGLTLLVVDTRAPHALVDGHYAERRRTCENAARQLGVASLREVDDLPAAVRRLTDDLARRRVAHVVTEIDRVRRTVDHLTAREWAQAGQLMNDSHRSLREDYEVSCRELDVVVDTAQQAGALGARMTGGGFGGSAIVLAEEHAVEDIATAIQDATRSRGLPEPRFHRVLAADAATRIA